MAASINDKLRKSYSLLQKTLDSTISDASTTITPNNGTNIPQDTAVSFIIDRVDSNGNRTDDKREIITGVFNGTAFTNCVRGVDGTTAQSHTAGAVIEFTMVGDMWNDAIDFLLQDHSNPSGYHKTLSDSNGNEWIKQTATTSAVNEITVANAATGNGPTISATGSDTNIDLNLAAKGTGNVVISSLASDGWSNLQATPDTITYNGNRSYDLVFNSVDLTDTVSEGMRLRTTRTVSAPTQCTDLEQSSSQYWSKTSPSGISFTTTFTCAAWVKLESYGAAGGIIARRNADTEGWTLSVEADGTVRLLGLRIASNNKQITSYQSIPLNKWVHVAACLDMAAGDTSAQKIWIDGVEVPRAYQLTGTATALVQGTTALVVGAKKSDGSNPFDGKIAQASVHSACLSDAQINAMMSQTISSSSPSIVSGYTFNGVATDVNTSNANDLSAVASAGYATDSPFGNYLGGTLDYGIITQAVFSTNTTLTVQVPEGCTIPTSGGVSALAYSTQDTPYGFVRDAGRWEVKSIYLTDLIRAGSAGVWYNENTSLSVPKGSWTLGYNTPLFTARSGTGSTLTRATLSTANNNESDRIFTTSISSIWVSSGNGEIRSMVYKEVPINTASATAYYLNHTVSSGTTSQGFPASNGSCEIVAKPTYL